jgi:hypothetical protein
MQRSKWEFRTGIHKFVEIQIGKTIHQNKSGIKSHRKIRNVGRFGGPSKARCKPSRSRRWRRRRRCAGRRVQVAAPLRRTSDLGGGAAAQAAAQVVMFLGAGRPGLAAGVVQSQNVHVHVSCHGSGKMDYVQDVDVKQPFTNLEAPVTIG